MLLLLKAYEKVKGELSMKILIVPDSFKGTLTSEQVCCAISEGIEISGNEITCMPFSDGGEGFSKYLANACKAKILYSRCTDIYGRAINAHYYTYDKTAIIECSTASGLQTKKDVMSATSFGTGELIKSAVSKGFSNIILGLGGSGCSDGGAGALSALGASFRDIYGEIIPRPSGRDIENIYGAGFANIVKGINFTYACDVENEYYGKNGAAYVFAKQKGADDNDIIHLDNGLKTLAAFLPFDLSGVKGAGAAGGLCGGLYSVYGGIIKSGFNILSQAYCLEEKISEADIIITGEGRTDSQTFMGKLVYRIAELAKKYDKKCIVISGMIDDGIVIGNSVIRLVDDETSIYEALSHPYRTLVQKSKKILQLI